MKLKIYFLFIFIVFSFQEENPYKILGVPKTATQAVIKKAFKVLSLKYHPDRIKNPTKSEKEKYVKIINAYELIKDETKRKEYDNPHKYSNFDTFTQTNQDPKKTYQYSYTSYTNGKPTSFKFESKTFTNSHFGDDDDDFRFEDDNFFNNNHEDIFKDHNDFINKNHNFHDNDDDFFNHDNFFDGINDYKDFFGRNKNKRNRFPGFDNTDKIHKKKSKKKKTKS